MPKTNKELNTFISENYELSDREIYEKAIEEGFNPPSLESISIRRWRLGHIRTPEEIAELTRKAHDKKT